MEPSVSSTSDLPPAVAEKIRHLPEAAKAAFLEFRRTRNSDVLDPLVFAMLESYVPKKPETPVTAMPGTTLLMDELGFDSLAIAELVFSTEDLFEIRISNEEVLQVRTIDDLRAFIRRKVTERA
jgi:acyl carrier protein